MDKKNRCKHHLHFHSGRKDDALTQPATVMVGCRQLRFLIPRITAHLTTSSNTTIPPGWGKSHRRGGTEPARVQWLRRSDLTLTLDLSEQEIQDTGHWNGAPTRSRAWEPDLSLTNLSWLLVNENGVSPVPLPGQWLRQVLHTEGALDPPRKNAQFHQSSDMSRLSPEVQPKVRRYRLQLSRNRSPDADF